MHLRHATMDDLTAMYAVALATGDSGSDATRLHRHPDLIGDVFVLPYVTHSPEHAYALIDDDERLVGYVLGVANTQAFEAWQAIDWWPDEQARLADLNDPTPADAWLLDRIMNPVIAPNDVAGPYPAHGHIDLIAPAQGQGWGRIMMSTVMESLARAGAGGMHLEVGATNSSALAFYQRLGFRPIVERDDSVFVGRALP